MGDYQLLIKIAGQLDGSLSASVKQAQSLLGQLNKKGVASAALKGIGDATRMLAKANMSSLAVIGAAAAKVIKDSFTAGMNLENAMTDLAGTAGVELGSEVFKQYEAAAKNVGRTTNKTSTEAAEALKYMALAGWDAERSIDALEGMVKLSSATGLDLARTSDLVTDSMGALGLTSKDYARYLDLVATADSSANYTGEQFMETMTRSGGAARNLNMSLEELSAMAGVLADNGTKGTQAGTAINRMLRNMRTDTAATAFEKLNMGLYNAQGEFKGLETVLGELNQAFEGKTTEEINGYMDSIFGAFSSQGKYLLEAQKSGRFAELVGQYAGDAVAGNLQERYATMTDNLKGDLDLLSSAYAAFGEDIYASLNQADSGIRSIVQSTTDYINQIHDAFNMDGLSGIADELGNIFGEVATQIQTAGPEAVNAAFDFVDQLYQSVGNETNAEAIGQAAASIITTLGERFITNTGEFAVAAGNIISALTEGLAAENAGERIATAISDSVANIGDWFAENAEGIGDAAGQLIQQFAQGIGEHADELVGGAFKIVSGLVKGLAQAAPYLISAAPQLIMALANGIINNIPMLMEAGLSLGKALFEGLKQGIDGIGDFIAEAITDLGGDLAIEVNPEIDYDNLAPEILTSIQADMGTLSGVWSTLDGDAQKYFASLAYGTTTVSELNEQIQGMDDLIDLDAANTGLAAFVEAANAAYAAGIGVSESEAEIATAAEEAGSAVTTSADLIAEAQQNIASAAGGDIDLGLDAIAEECESAGEAIAETESAMQTLDGTIASMGDMGGDIFGDLIQADDMTARAAEITSAMETVASGVTSAISTMQSGVAGSMSSLAESLSSAGDAFNSLVDAANSAAEGVASAMQTAASEAAAAMASIADLTGSVSTPTATGDPAADLDTSSKEITVTMDASQVTAAVAEIQTALTTMSESATTAGASFSAGIQVVATSTQAASSAASSAIISMVSIMVSQFAVAVGSAQASASGIYSAFASIDLAGVAANMMAGLTAGIQAGGAAAVAAAQSVASQVAAAMSAALQIHSPSKVTEEIGYYTGAGIPVGLQDSLPETLTAAKNFSGAITDTMDNSLSAPITQIAESGTRSKAATQTAKTESMTPVFSPTINITLTGNSTEEAAQEIASLTMDQFRRFYEQMIRQDRRVSFA